MNIFPNTLLNTLNRGYEKGAILKSVKEGDIPHPFEKFPGSYNRKIFFCKPDSGASMRRTNTIISNRKHGNRFTPVRDRKGACFWSRRHSPFLRMALQQEFPEYAKKQNPTEQKSYRYYFDSLPFENILGQNIRCCVLCSYSGVRKERLGMIFVYITEKSPKIHFGKDGKNQKMRYHFPKKGSRKGEGVALC